MLKSADVHMLLATLSPDDIRREEAASADVYEAAVRGRQDFRNAYRKLLPVLRAAETISRMWRSPQQPFQVSDEFADAVNALDVAVTGGGAKPLPFDELPTAIRSQPSREGEK